MKYPGLPSSVLLGSHALSVKLLSGDLGRFIIFLLLCSSSPIQALDTTPVPSNGSLDVNFYLIVYGSIAGANSLFTILRAFLFAYGTIHAASVIHNRLLQRALKVMVRKSKAGWGSCKSLCPMFFS